MTDFRTRRTLSSLAVALLAIAGLVTGVLVANSAVGTAAGTVKARYSPLGATANGPSGPATAKFTAGPYCCPSTGVALTPTTVSTESDFQWVQLGLPSDLLSVSAVEVCYALTTVVGRSYISQTRVTDMTTPNSAVVRLDDPTDRTAVGPACYTVPASITPTGSLALSLKVVFGSTSDRINLGQVALTGVSG